MVWCAGLFFPFTHIHANTRIEPVIPTPMPDIPFRDINNRIHTLKDFSGKVILVNIWATSCIPCAHEMPELDWLMQVFAGQPFMVVPIAMDNNAAEAIPFFYKQLQLQRLPVYFDDSFQWVRGMEVRGIPTSFIVDKEGNMIGKVEGTITWKNKAVQQYFQQLLDYEGNIIKKE